MKSISKRMRDRVVELLRCAADVGTGDAHGPGWDAIGLGKAAGLLGASDAEWLMAFHARCDVVDDWPPLPDTSETYRLTCLEAALRLERSEP